MLKILCCVKQVPDVDQMRMDPETGNLIRAGVPAILNPLDANALSAAVKVKEAYGGEITRRGSRAARVPRRRRGQGDPRHRPRVWQRRHAGHQLFHRLRREAGGRL